MPTKRTRTPKTPSSKTPSASRLTTPPKVEAPMIVRTRQAPAREEIGRRAYDLYIARGYQDGHDVEDWLQAENEAWARV